MPVIVLYGIPKRLKDDGALNALVLRHLPAAVAGIAELELTAKQVSLFCPQDALSAGLGEELIAFVAALSVGPKRTPLVKKRLAEAVCAELALFAKANLPECGLIEVFVQSFNQESEGAASWRP